MPHILKERNISNKHNFLKNPITVCVCSGKYSKWLWSRISHDRFAFASSCPWRINFEIAIQSLYRHTRLKNGIVDLFVTFPDILPHDHRRNILAVFTLGVWELVPGHRPKIVLCLDTVNSKYPSSIKYLSTRLRPWTWAWALFLNSVVSTYQAETAPSVNRHGLRKLWRLLSFV